MQHLMGLPFAGLLAAATDTKKNGSPFASVLLLAVFGGLAERLATQLQPGVEVLTSGGMFGTIIESAADHVVIELAPGVRVRFAPQAIGRVISKPVEDPSEGPDGPREPPFDAPPPPPAG